MINKIKKELQCRKRIQLNNYHNLFMQDRFENMRKLNDICSILNDIDLMIDMINKDEDSYKDILKILRKL